jgi:putative ATP-binding cassette transporter
MRLINFLWGHSRGVIALAALVGIISGGSSALLMALINARLSIDAPPSKALIWGFAGVVVIALISNYASRVLLSQISQQAIFALRMRLCRQVLSSPLRRLEEIGSPRILATLTQDIPTITRAFLDLPFFCINLTIVVGCLIYLGWLAPSILSGVVVFLLLGMLGLTLPKKKADRAWKLGREEADTLFEHFRALTGGIKELTLHRARQEAFLADRLEASAVSYRDHQIKAGKLYAVSGGWGFVLYFVFMGFLLFAVPAWLNISLLALTGYTLTTLYLRAPLVALIDSISTFSQANMSLQKFDELGLSLAPAEARRDSTKREDEPAPSWEQLHLSSLTHAYFREGLDSNFALGPINLTFTRGELVFLMGGNGSGKTTLAKLLAGLYTPETGEIFVDGRPVDENNRDEYRQLFSAIFSDFHLFELLGLNNDNLEQRAQGYIERLQLGHKVKVQGDRFSTTELSQGQRKRLALLTSYLEDRSIYIFDEWAADQDPYFKEVFYLELLPELKAKGKTVIVISHDDRYIHVADRLIKLDYGIVEEDLRLNPSRATSRESLTPALEECIASAS